MGGIAGKARAPVPSVSGLLPVRLNPFLSTYPAGPLCVVCPLCLSFLSRLSFSPTAHYCSSIGARGSLLSVAPCCYVSSEAAIVLRFGLFHGGSERRSSVCDECRG